MPSIRIEPFILGDFLTNCYVVRDADRPECWIIDCGRDPDPMLEFIEQKKLAPQAILLTHAHCDHIWGIDDALSRLGELPIYLHQEEREWCQDPMLNLSALMGLPVSVSGPTTLLKGGEALTLGGSTWRVLHTPGHSPGSVCFINDDAAEAIVGDTLFAGSMGRIDFPTSDPHAMRRTLLETMLALPDAMRIHPGHGESTTIGRERRTNPFLRAQWWEQELRTVR
jgi:glyoxylase-like metal-dependent hydrolase (beta-lactamase superfamily II)